MSIKFPYGNETRKARNICYLNFWYVLLYYFVAKVPVNYCLNMSGIINSGLVVIL